MIATGRTHPVHFSGICSPIYSTALRQSVFVSPWIVMPIYGPLGVMCDIDGPQKQNSTYKVPDKVFICTGAILGAAQTLFSDAGCVSYTKLQFQELVFFCTSCLPWYIFAHISCETQAFFCLDYKLLYAWYCLYYCCCTMSRPARVRWRMFRWCGDAVQKNAHGQPSKYRLEHRATYILWYVDTSV